MLWNHLGKKYWCYKCLFPFSWIFLDAFPFCLSCSKHFRLVKIRGCGELLIHDSRGKNQTAWFSYFLSTCNIHNTQDRDSCWPSISILSICKYLFSPFVREFWVLAGHILNTIFPMVTWLNSDHWCINENFMCGFWIVSLTENGALSFALFLPFCCLERWHNSQSLSNHLSL